MNIEEAKKKLIEWVDDDRVLRDNSTESDFDKFCEEKNIAIETVLAELDKQEKIINAMAKDMFCYLNNTIFTYLDTSTFLLGLLVTAKKVNSVEELKQYYEKKVSEE